MDKSKNEERRRGAPITERRRVPLGIRITPEMRDELVARAEAKGRSITSQTEVLLEQGVLIDRLAGAGLRPMVQVLTEFDQAGSRYAEECGVEGDWTLDPEAYKFALAAAVARLVYLTPGPWDGIAVHAMVEDGFSRAEWKRAQEAGYKWRIKE